MRGAEQGGKQAPLLIQWAHLAPNPNTHLVTSKWSSSLYLPYTPFPSIKKKKIYHPIQDTPSHPTHIGGKEEHGTPWVQEKNRERKKRLVWSSASWSGFLRPPLPPSTVGCRPHSPAAPRCFSAAGSHQPRFQVGVGARRCRWEGVGDRGLRCQRPPPLEVGREQIHLCCLLFFWTCPAICLSLSCSPATGRL